MTITPDLAGEIKEGYKITSIDVTPKIVALRGKEEIVNQYNEVLTQTINLDELDQTLITKVNLVLPDDIETPKMTDLPEITINIEPIESKEFTFNASQISVNNLKDVLTTNIGELEDDIKVNISDVRSVLAGITRNDMELVIYATDLNEGSHTVDITVNTDIPIELIEILPNRIQIEVYKKEVENINNETINQNINNTSNTNRENSN